MSSSDEFAPAINKMAQEIKRIETEAAELKRTVNKLCCFAGRAPMYINADVVSEASLSSLRRDQFFGVALATAVRDYLTMRGDPKSGGMGAATVNEIFDALIEGGFKFETKNDENAKRGLRISLAKNVAAFTKVGGSGEGAFGLADWYPNVKVPKSQDQQSNDKQPETETTPSQKTDEVPSSTISSDVSKADQSTDASEPSMEGEEDGLANYR